MLPAGDCGMPNPVVEGVATRLAGRLGMTGNAGGSYALGTMGCASADGTCCGFRVGGENAECGAVFAGLATREGPLGGPAGGGGVTPGGAEFGVLGPPIPNPDGRVGIAKGVMTGAADAGLETAFAIGIIGGSYAVDVFIRLSVGGGAGFVGTVFA
jgi:hypothetical protein